MKFPLQIFGKVDLGLLNTTTKAIRPKGDREELVKLARDEISTNLAGLFKSTLSE